MAAAILIELRSFPVALGWLLDEAYETPMRNFAPVDIDALFLEEDAGGGRGGGRLLCRAIIVTFSNEKSRNEFREEDS